MRVFPIDLAAINLKCCDPLRLFIVLLGYFVAPWI